MSDYVSVLAAADLPPGQAAEVTVAGQVVAVVTSAARSTPSPAAARTAGGRSARGSWTVPR